MLVKSQNPMSYHHDMFLAIARKTKVLASHTPRFAPSRCNSASALGGKKCSNKGWSSSSKTKWGSRWIKNSLEMWDWRPEKSWIQATKIGIWHTTRDSTNKIDDCDEAIKRADLTNTQKKNGQNGFPSKHLTLWNMGIGSLPCSVVLVWLVRIYPIYPKITQVQPNVANRCLL